MVLLYLWVRKDLFLKSDFGDVLLMMTLRPGVLFFLWLCLMNARCYFFSPTSFTSDADAITTFVEPQTFHGYIRYIYCGRGALLPVHRELFFFLSFFLFFFFFGPTPVLIRAVCGCGGHSRLAGPRRSPLFLYYPKQIRGSGEHTQMQIAAERPHFNLAL